MDKVKVFITGANGQLGTDLVRLLQKKNCIVYGFSRNELDITNFNDVKQLMEEIKPNVVINTAAHTKVDLAESEPDQAFRINAIGTRNIAVAAESVGAKLIHISTDYVFDGSSDKPYGEFDATSPLGVYGKSKLAGEQFVRDLHSKFFILRTSWVFGVHGTNFVKTMMKLGSERDQLNVVYDQVGCPTFTVDLSMFIAEIMQTELYGIYHVSNSGSCSWYEFAKAIFEEAEMKVQVNPVTTDEFPRPAQRPAYSVLDHMAIRLNGLKDLPNWEDALQRFIREYKESTLD